MANFIKRSLNLTIKYIMPIVTVFVVMSSVATPIAFAADASGCKTGGDSLFGIPTWYEYLNFEKVNDKCSITNTGTEVVLLVMFAALDIMFYLSGFIAAGYIIWGGFKFILAQGAPDKISSARNTILNAVIGLVIVIVASGAVSFIAKRVGGL